jgi:hypothetical protein
MLQREGFSIKKKKSVEWISLIEESEQEDRE